MCSLRCQPLKLHGVVSIEFGCAAQALFFYTSSKRFIYFFLSVEFNNLFMNFLTLYFPNGKNLDALSDFFSRNAT
tara:strand:+ start:721 stop:945 length:225 start_codon:yes stop_codon:yes gene_type:complete